VRTGVEPVMQMWRRGTDGFGTHNADRIETFGASLLGQRRLQRSEV
jgi:hypothetical protein